MSGPGASSSEMHALPIPGLHSREPDEQLLDMLLAGQPLPPDAPEQLHEVAELFARLTGPAGPAGWLGRRRHGRRSPVPPPAQPGSRELPEYQHDRGRPGFIPESRPEWRRPGRGCGRPGGGVAAYAGALPGPIQEIAHHVSTRQALSDIRQVLPGASLKHAYRAALRDSTPRPGKPQPTARRG